MKKSVILAAVASAMFSLSAMAALTSESKIADIMAATGGKEVLVKHVPELANAPLDRIGQRSLKDLSARITTLTPDKLKEIDADLAKLK